MGCSLHQRNGRRRYRLPYRKSRLQEIILHKEECSPERLPAAGIAEAVVKSLRQFPFLVVTAAPGAGKSTYLPIAILNGLEDNGKVLVLEPRRIAARQIAERMAWLLGEEVGGTVGYRIRFESRVSSKTRIEILTEGILTKMISDDPTLDGVGCIIFDEFHERSLTSDLALALARESFRLIRPDLRIVIMSATIDSSAICTALGAPVISSEGRMFPVEVIHSVKDTSEEDCAKDVARAVVRACMDNSGSILAFLPGEYEIRQCAALLENSMDGAGIYPLYGMLTSEDQKKAISPAGEGERKIVLATPIAETSITIEGVSIVIDSGYCRRLVFDRQNGLSRLETVRISMDMARQRTGRAGRTGPGICYRLWTPSTERMMQDCRRPEILDADLSPAVLAIAGWGEGNVADLQWLTPPPPDRLKQAESLLFNIGAVDRSGRITPHGRSIASLPCHPRIANMLARAMDRKDRALAADIAAVLEEKDKMSLELDGADISLRINEFRKNRNSRTWSRTARISQQYRSLCNAIEDNSIADCLAAGRLLALAYPERIGQNKGCGHFLLANGETAAVGMSDPLAACDHIAIGSMNSRLSGEGRILLACEVSPEDTGLIRERNVIAWDSREAKVIARRESRIGRILIGTKPLPVVSREDIITAICDAAVKEGRSMFDFNESVGNLQRRISCAASWIPDQDIPEVSDNILLARVDEWLPAFIGNASSAAELKRIDLCQVIWSLLSYEQQLAVDRLAPSHIEVPTGSRIRLEYRPGTDRPVLRVRLQECFGMLDTPTVNGGMIHVTMELLSPGFKPVQLTSDLRSFWNGTYFEVRKELRRRYPKHSWPEDPLTAPATRTTKKQNH